METQYAIGEFSIRSSDHRFSVYHKDKALSEFGNYDDAAALLQDLHLSKTASEDDLIGTTKFCEAMAGNGNAVVIVANVKDGYLVQIAGTTDRIIVSPEYLSGLPMMFADAADEMGVPNDAPPAAAPMDAMVDVTVQDEGTIVLLHLISESAKTWVAENVESAPRVGDAIAVEHRYADPIIDGMLADGLVVE